ncbi:unnamed protein product [Rotaria socialis]|uniref:Uncharacterized protein n=2 Tax=Rotaria socialis TaxID=392032 RepID=A0A820JPR0_9BILA|nr:unnamed protein product [Rotaria socialis]
MNYHQTTLLRRLHVIDIAPQEFDKLLRNHVVCASLSVLTICRLQFNFPRSNPSQLSRDSAPSRMTLPNISNTIYLHTLTTGINTLHFLQRLLERIHFIENLSLDIQDSDIYDPLIISGDIIQQLCIDRLKPSAKYTLNLSIGVWNDMKNNTIFNSFLETSFSRRERPRVFIQEQDSWNIAYDVRRFVVYTTPYNAMILSAYLFSTD